MSIHDLAVRWAAGLARELGSDQKHENRMAFGLELLLGEIIKWIVLLGLAGMLGLLREVVIICASAGILRLASGGEHCNEYYRCLIGGTIWFLLLGWGVSWLNTLLTGENLIIIAGIVFVLSAYLLWLYAPGDTANKPIDDEDESRKFKRLSLLVALCYLVVMIGTAQFSAAQFVSLTVAAGMLAQVFTVTPLGYTFLHWVDRVLTFD